MHTLIIKGNEAAAFAACDARKLEITSIAHRPRFDETYVTVPASVPVSDLVEWFCADNHAAPHADGTLLWYGPARLPMPDNATQFGHVVPKPCDKAGTATQDDLFYSRAAGAHIDLDKSVVGKDDQ